MVLNGITPKIRNFVDLKQASLDADVSAVSYKR